MNPETTDDLRDHRFAVDARAGTFGPEPSVFRSKASHALAERATTVAVVLHTVRLGDATGGEMPEPQVETVLLEPDLALVLAEQLKEAAARVKR